MPILQIPYIFVIKTKSYRVGARNGICPSADGALVRKNLPQAAFLTRTLQIPSLFLIRSKKIHRIYSVYLFRLVRGMGFEPTRTNVRYPLKVVRLPVPPSSQVLSFCSSSERLYIISKETVIVNRLIVKKM